MIAFVIRIPGDNACMLTYVNFDDKLLASKTQTLCNIPLITVERFCEIVFQHYLNHHPFLLLKVLF